MENPFFPALSLARLLSHFPRWHDNLQLLNRGRYQYPQSQSIQLRSFTTNLLHNEHGFASFIFKALPMGSLSSLHASVKLNGRLKWLGILFIPNETPQHLESITRIKGTLDLRR